MAYEENLRSISYDADASIGIYTGVPGQPGSAVPNGAKQYHALKITGKNQVGLCTTNADLHSVLQNKPQRPGQAATCGYEGVTNCVAGAAVAAGDLVGPNAQGAFVPTANGKLRAVTIAAGAGELFSAQFV